MMNSKLKSYKLGKVVLTQSNTESQVYLSPDQEFIMTEQELKLLGAELCGDNSQTNS